MKTFHITYGDKQVASQKAKRYCVIGNRVDFDDGNEVIATYFNVESVALTSDESAPEIVTKFPESMEGKIG